MSPLPPPSPPVAAPLAALLRPLQADLLRALGLSVFTGVLALASAWYMQMIYDRVVTSRSLTTLVWVSLAVLLAYGMLALQSWARGALLRTAAERLDATLAALAAGSAWRRRLADPAAPGLARVADDLRLLRDSLHAPALLAVLDLPMTGLLLLLLSLISPWLGLLVAGAGLLLAALTWAQQRRHAAALHDTRRLLAAGQHQADQARQAAAAVQAMGMGPALQARQATADGQALALQAAVQQAAARWQAASRWLSQAVSSLLLGLGAWLAWHELLHGGGAMLAIAGILGARLLAPFTQLLSQGAALVQALDAARRLQQLLAEHPAAPPSLPLPPPRGELRVEQVAACAPGQSLPWLQGLHWRLAPGQALAVIGPSGAGKSMLARVLLGLWPVAAGAVRLDGVDLGRWPKAELGPHLGYLPQEPAPLDGTLAEHIARCGPVDHALLQQALADTGLADWVAQLPQGAHTPLGEGGLVLSGGQRQRVGLARALYGRPRLVVLDEPNAHLDEAGDAALAALLARRAELGISFVLMTHRASVLAQVDRVLLLAQGRQQAEGPRDEVLASLRGPAPAAPAQPAAAAGVPA